MQPKRKINPALASLIVIVLVGIITTAVLLSRKQAEETGSPNNATSESQPAQAMGQQNSSGMNESTQADNKMATYKNGVYNATGSYITPGGNESIVVTATLNDDIITEAIVSPNAKSGEAKEYQDKFVTRYKTMVVGKNIDEVSLSRVAGSSLTSNGFNDALDQIKNDAKL